MPDPGGSYEHPKKAAKKRAREIEEAPPWEGRRRGACVVDWWMGGANPGEHAKSGIKYPFRTISSVITRACVCVLVRVCARRESVKDALCVRVCVVCVCVCVWC